MRVLDLFSGIGGFSLAAQQVGWETVGFCESDEYCKKVLRKHWPSVRIWEDVKELAQLKEPIGCDVITGGFPCQPFSYAGDQQGQQDDRFLWPSMLQIIESERPSWVVAENVAGIVSMAIDQVLADLGDKGYAARAVIIPATAVGAPHQRDRAWIIAHTNSKPMPVGSIPRGRKKDKRMASGWWQDEPRVARVADGVSDRTHRLRCLGNAIVPQVAAEIFRAIQQTLIK